MGNVLLGSSVQRTLLLSVEHAKCEHVVTFTDHGFDEKGFPCRSRHTTVYVTVCDVEGAVVDAVELPFGAVKDGPPLSEQLFTCMFCAVIVSVIGEFTSAPVGPLRVKLDCGYNFILTVVVPVDFRPLVELATTLINHVFMAVALVELDIMSFVVA